MAVSVNTLLTFHDVIITGDFNTTIPARRRLISVIQAIRVYAISGRMWQYAILVVAFNAFPLYYAFVSYH